MNIVSHPGVPDISKLVDHRNLDLWEFLNKTYSISLKFHAGQEYICNYGSKTAVIHVPFCDYSVAAFTHELLHLYLDSKGVYISGYITLLFRGDDVLSTVFTEELVLHIGNTLDHGKMLNLYLALGFPRNEFLLDYDVHKCTGGEITLINLFLQPGHAKWKAAADLYLGKFFAIKSCPNSTIDYSTCLDELKRIDEPLFHLLNKFWESWIAFDIETSGYPGYHAFCDIWTSELKEWVAAFDNSARA